MRLPSIFALAASSLRPRSSSATRACLTSASPTAADSGAPRITLTLRGPDDTLALGACLASLVKAGDTMLLHGDYGAGKTCLARGFLRHWYSDPREQVTSPSYLIDNVYDDPDSLALLPGVTVHHMDLWRLPEGKIQQLVDLPHVFSQCVSLIEWPERLGAELTPPAYLDVRLDILGDDGEEAMAKFDRGADERVTVLEGVDDEQPRLATLTAYGEEWELRLESIAEEFNG